jgi:hypothetical protein
MACGCRKKNNGETRAAPAVPSGGYQVWLNDNYTGRTFMSLSTAQTYAKRVGGEVRSA